VNLAIFDEKPITVLVLAMSHVLFSIQHICFRKTLSLNMRVPNLPRAPSNLFKPLVLQAKFRLLTLNINLTDKTYEVNDLFRREPFRKHCINVDHITLFYTEMIIHLVSMLAKIERRPCTKVKVLGQVLVSS